MSIPVMAAYREVATRPLLQCLHQRPGPLLLALAGRLHTTTTRSFSSSPTALDEQAPPTTTDTPRKRSKDVKVIDPALVTSPKLERRLVRAGTHPIGSRRRRAALKTSENIPFEQLPYQCFQEARQILIEDRAEKIKMIEGVRGRLARLRERPAAEMGGELQKAVRIRSTEKYLEKLKIYADINDPTIKRRFEDGFGDMNKPIYRFLADRKWREYRRKILVQRITQMKVIPDVLPHCDPVVDIRLWFGKRPVPPGEFVNSAVSQVAPRLSIQPFEGGQKLVTIAVVDPDVPNWVTDGFESQCHFLAINVPISPIATRVELADLSPESQVIFPWLPPHAQKGSPYHRLSLFVMEQADPLTPMDREKVAAKAAKREGFSLRSLETRHKLKPIGAHLFRTQWDETMAAVMQQAGIDGWDIELKRKRVEPLPYKPKNPVRYR